jgi:hypothetical protein
MGDISTNTQISSAAQVQSTRQTGAGTYIHLSSDQLKQRLDFIRQHYGNNHQINQYSQRALQSLQQVREGDVTVKIHDVKLHPQIPEASENQSAIEMLGNYLSALAVLLKDNPEAYQLILGAAREQQLVGAK